MGRAQHAASGEWAGLRGRAGALSWVASCRTGLKQSYGEGDGKATFAEVWGEREPSPEQRIRGLGFKRWGPSVSARQDLMNLKTKTKGSELIFPEGQAFNIHRFP